MDEKEGKARRQEKKQFSLTQSVLAANLTVKLLAAAVVVVVLIFVGIGIGKSFTAESKTTKLGFEDIGELVTQAAYSTAPRSMLRKPPGACGGWISHLLRANTYPVMMWKSRRGWISAPLNGTLTSKMR